MANILIVDDDKMLCDMVTHKLGLEHKVAKSHNLSEGLAAVSKNVFDLVLLDVRLPDGSGLEAIPQIKATESQPELIIITGEGDPAGAELALMTGAWDYIEKPLSMREITLQVTRALEYRKEKTACKPKMILKRENIIGSNSSLTASLEKVAVSAVTDMSVLITGETGTGKELFARAVHENSLRESGPFIVLDCAAFPEKLVESVLFGHKKGAFTGADQDQGGVVLQANKGTLFMDEVGELPYNLQKAFLRVLQEKRFRSIGGKDEIESDFRLITATNRDLEKMVKEGQFRQDLLYRLKASTIHLPPLRDRQEDVETLTLHYVGHLAKRYGMNVKGVSSEFLDTLRSYTWPGNVRELVNVVEYAIAHSQMDDLLLPIHLPVDIRVSSKYQYISEQSEAQDKNVIKDHTGNKSAPGTYKDVMEETEKSYFQDLMFYSQGKIQEACSLSGLSRSGLYSRLKKYSIKR